MLSQRSEGDLKVEGEGTLVWYTNDNQRRRHEIKIKNYLYVLDLPSCLAYPQYWAKLANNNFPSPKETWCAIYKDSCVLQWGQIICTRTTPLDDKTDSPKLFSTLCCGKYRWNITDLELAIRCSEIEQIYSLSWRHRKEGNHKVCQESLLIRLDQGDEGGDSPGIFLPRTEQENEDIEEEINVFDLEVSQAGF